jgi:hypothetical protein
VFGNPPAMVVAWGSNEVNIFAVNDRMAAKVLSLCSVVLSCKQRFVCRDGL